MMTWEEALARAESLPRGSLARVDAALEAVRLADASDDLEASAETRSELTDAASFAGHHDVALDACAWLLARADEDPEHFYPPLWQYKWIVANIPASSAIPLERLDALVADLGRRFQEAGASPAPASKLAMEVLQQTGRHDGLADAYHRWKADLASPQRYLNDCRACDLATEVSVLVTLGQEIEALAAADRMRSGGHYCHEQPRCTIASLLTTTYRIRGRDATLADLPDAKSVLYLDDVAEIGPLLTGLAVVGEHREALDIISDKLPALHRNRLDGARFEFLVGALVALQRAATAGVELERPVELAGGGPTNGQRDSSEQTDRDRLLAWVDDQVHYHASRLDGRNGNRWYAEQIEHHLTDH